LPNLPARSPVNCCTHSHGGRGRRGRRRFQIPRMVLHVDRAHEFICSERAEQLCNPDIVFQDVDDAVPTTMAATQISAALCRRHRFLFLVVMRRNHTTCGGCGASTVPFPSCGSSPPRSGRRKATDGQVRFLRDRGRRVRVFVAIVTGPGCVGSVFCPMLLGRDLSSG
jgi:hypothetical protein